MKWERKISNQKLCLKETFAEYVCINYTRSSRMKVIKRSEKENCPRDIIILTRFQPAINNATIFSSVVEKRRELSSCRHVAAQRSNIRSDSFPLTFENILLRKP